MFKSFGRSFKSPPLWLPALTQGTRGTVARDVALGNPSTVRVPCTIGEAAETCDIVRRGADDVRTPIQCSLMTQIGVAITKIIQDVIAELIFETDPRKASTSDYEGTKKVALLSLRVVYSPAIFTI